MATYDYEALKQVWIYNGGDPAAAGIAAAIALAESGGNPNAIGHNSNGTVDRGLWQINSIHGNQSTTDIIGNVKAAIAISNNGKNWRPWTTYGSGAYLKFLNPKDPALIGTSSVDVPNPSPIDSLTSGLSSIGSSISGIASGASSAVKAGTWLANPHNTIRIFLVVTGGGMVLLGMGLVFRGTLEGPIGSAVETVKTTALAAA